MIAGGRSKIPRFLTSANSEELGREEGAAPYDAGEGPAGVRLEAVE